MPLVPLGQMPRGACGIIAAIDTTMIHSHLPPAELERRLLELGMVEGARVDIRHQGLFGRDPIAVRVDCHATFALRRREASAVMVRLLAPEDAK